MNEWSQYQGYGKENVPSYRIDQPPAVHVGHLQPLASHILVIITVRIYIAGVEIQLIIFVYHLFAVRFFFFNVLRRYLKTCEFHRAIASS
jgi:hypothetical protein